VVNTPTTKAEVKPVAQAEVAPVVVTNQHISVDLDKLAYAVAMAETKNCTRGMGLSRNNAFGIMTWERGFREGRTYAKCEDSYADFKKIWAKYYGGFPTWEMANRWTGSDNVQTWLDNVTFYYYN